MTVYQKAQQIAANGMQAAEVFAFFDATWRKMSEIDYIALFSQFGVDHATVWDMYEDWQDAEA